MIKKNSSKISQVLYTTDSSLSVFVSLYMMEFRFSNAHYLQSKQRSTFNIKYSNFWFKLRNLLAQSAGAVEYTDCISAES